MDEVIFILALMFLGVILDLIKKAQKKGAPPPASDDERLEAETELRDVGRDIQDLIAEELGINLERRPRVQQLPQGRPQAPAEEHRPRIMPAAPAESAAVIYPKRKERKRGSLAESGRDLPGDRRRAAIQQRRDARAQSPQAEPTVPLSLEERALLERGEPISLETERRPEDHDRFHTRFGVPEPVSSHQEFHDRYVSEKGRPPAARRSVLPESKYWSFAQKAIVWGEILGPPKGLIEE